MPSSRLLLVLAAALLPLGAQLPQRFEIQGDRFVADGQPTLIRSGELHYPRIPKEYWRDRMKKMKALGLNTLCTYVFWNLHEAEEGRFDFSGQLDLVAYLKMAQEEGLMVILRPGPYICTEWDFGGLPGWLLKDRTVRVRTSDPRFMAAAGRYLAEVGRRVKGLNLGKGGPIILTQIENEYGSFDKDKVYLEGIRKLYLDGGFEGPFFTSDGTSTQHLEGGTLPGALSVVNFGVNAKPEGEFEALKKFRPGAPLMCGEYWTGWFDHWGKPHHTASLEQGAKGIDWMLKNQVSFNLYMVHGGTNFGFMNGANWVGRYAPDTSSYDYDVIFDEAGRPTAKFKAYRDVILASLPAGTKLPELPAAQKLISIPEFRFTESASLEGLLKAPQKSEKLKTMEEAGQSLGFILYRHPVTKPITEVLEVKEVRDFAVITQGQRRFGTLDRRLRQSCVDVDLKAGEPLDLLVENWGRINFDKPMLDESKGITEKVLLGDREVKGWEIHPLPMTDLSSLVFKPGRLKGPAFHRAHFELKNVGDTFIDTRGWGKGNVWVNGHNLGRFWQAGPQQTLYCPAPWLKKGRNEVVVLELLENRQATMKGVPDLVFGVKIGQ